MYYKISLLLLISILSFYSCEFSPTETYYNEITLTQPNIDLVILDENKLNTLRGIVNISYSSVLDGKKLKLIEASIEGAIVDFSGRNEDVLQIDTRVFPDGEYILQMKMITSTETGSLADIIGSEVFIFTKEYDIYILNASITPPEIKEMFIEDSALRVKWERYEGVGFQKYILANYNIPIREIYNQDSLECIDYGYIGGYANRKLITIIAGHSFESSSKTFNSPVIEFTSASLIDENKIHLEWQRNNFDSAFSYYKIYLGHYDDPEAYVMIHDINTTNYIVEEPVFGGQPSYGLLAIPQAGMLVESYPNYITAPAVGYEINYKEADFLEYVPALNSYFVYQSNNVYVYDLSFNLINSAQYSFNSYYAMLSADISSNGELFFIVQDANAADIAKININTLQVEHTYNLNDIAGFEIGFVSAICISDNNLLLVFAGVYQPSRTYVFDLNTQSLVTFVPFNDSYITFDIKISNNGQYVRTQDDLFKLENSTLVFIGNVSRESRFLEDSEYLVNLASYNTIQILKCSDLSIQKEYVFPYTLYMGAKLNVDKTDGYIGVESSSRGHFYILDMENPELKKRIATLNSYDTYYTYQNKAIIGNNRAMYVNF